MPHFLSASARLLTLTGPGGSGKTRLAQETLRRLAPQFAGAAWFVSLADLTDARLIGQAIREGMRLPSTANRDPLEQVGEALSKKPALLILDNFEQLVEAGADSVQRLFELAPTLICLVTSRQRLNLYGEREFPVTPLPTPGAGKRRRENGKREAWNPEALLEYPSVRLFVDRAQAAQPDFQITRANAEAIAELCDRLEGIPLSIELAAARAQVMTPAQMLGQLADRFTFLISRRRDIPERFRILRAAIDWSYDLLPPESRRFFARLSVFRGGWTAEAAEAVCDSRSEVLALLEQLCERSLVTSEAGGETMRFRMLETLREYAAERLTPEESVTLSRRRTEYFLGLAERAEPELAGAEQAPWLARLEAEHDNLRAALADSMERDPQEALRLAVALRRFWYVRGYLSEAERWLECALRLTEGEPTELRAKAFNSMGAMARDRGDLTQAETMYRQALTLFQALDHTWGIAATLHNLGVIASDRGDYKQAYAAYDRATALWRQIGDTTGQAQALLSLGLMAHQQGDQALATSAARQSVALFRVLNNRWGVASALHILGCAADDLDDTKQAAALMEESLTISQEIGNRRGIALALGSLGDVALKQEDWERAGALYRESLTLFQEIEDRWGVVQSVRRVAWKVYRQGRFPLAARLQGARDALSETLLVSLLSEQDNPLPSLLREALGDTAFEAAYQEGRALNREQTLAEALENA